MTKFNSNDEHKNELHWRSVDDLENNPEFLETLQREFPQGASELEIRPGSQRRKFLGLIGASMALAGVATSGCIRRPKEHIYPETNRPEDSIPGVAKFYATSAVIAGSAVGLSVTSTDGRPTKIDGNYRHPMNNPIAGSKLGSSNSFIQAEILNMYDPDRGQKFYLNSKETSKKETYSALNNLLNNFKKNEGNGLVLLYSPQNSPTFSALLKEFKVAYPKALLVENDISNARIKKESISKIVSKPVNVENNFLNADVVLSVDSDFMGLDADSVKNAREFSEKRKLVNNQSKMNRLYCVESNFSITGTAADHHYTLRSNKTGDFLNAIASELQILGCVFPSEISKNASLKSELPDSLKKWIKACAKDLYANKSKSLVVVGDRQPAWIHSLGFAINNALENLGKTVILNLDTTFVESANLLEFKSYLEKGAVNTLIVIDANIAYTSAVDLNLNSFLPKIKNSFYLNMYKDETADLLQYYLPKTHFLESWGDVRSSNGTISIKQPLIAPLFENCIDEISFIKFLVTLDDKQSNYQIVKGHWQNNYASQSSVLFDTTWRKFLSEGIVINYPKDNFIPSQFLYNYHEESFAKAQKLPEPSSSSLDIEFYLDKTVYDGTYTNNAWLQEVPDPIHKLVWDNALLINAKTAKQLGINARPKPGKSEVDLVKVTYKGRSLNVAVWETPGVADNTVILHLGYGRKFGRVAQGTGFNANLLKTSDSWFGSGVTLEKTGQKYSLVSAQEHGVMSGTPNKIEDRPPAVRQASLTQYKENSKFVLKHELMPIEKQKNNLFKFPVDPAQKKWGRQQWGMVIDLNNCIGCNACTIACQSENNISVVGKEEVFKNREMSWIRVDRYFTGSIDDPEMQTVFQPLNCQHCENAPCEAVCPIAATVHSPDGLNDMVYNRCVGTRYCANNCPYKVRRYNFFNYSKADDERNPLYAMQKNPNVTVRFRGVMEKCSYCVQKINVARSKFKKTNDGLIPDGEVVTACQSACPTNAIVFGDIADPNTAVSKLKSQDRNYSLLGELNVKPRTTYLAKIRNTNPDLV